MAHATAWKRLAWRDDDPAGLVGVGNTFDADAAVHWPVWRERAQPGRDGHAFTAPVGSFAPNAFGLFDMPGKVWEWVSDLQEGGYYAQSPTDDPTGLPPPRGYHARRTITTFRRKVMSITLSRSAALALFAAVAVAAVGLPAHASNGGQRKPPTKVTFHKAPSEEAPAAREKRLKRECQGRPNAGMCAGHTR